MTDSYGAIAQRNEVDVVAFARVNIQRDACDDCRHSSPRLSPGGAARVKLRPERRRFEDFKLTFARGSPARQAAGGVGETFKRSRLVA